MFEKKSSNDNANTPNDSLDVFKPTKGSAKVVIGNGVKIKGEITNADEVQIDGYAKVKMHTDNLFIGSTGVLTGTISTHNADIWGKVDGEFTVSGNLTIQEQGSVSGNIEYQSLQIKLGGKILGDIKVSEKIKKLSDHIKKNNEKENEATPLQDVKDKKPA